jgi:hypothetical protein
MATKFQKGQTVRLDKTVPQGTMEKLRMDEERQLLLSLAVDQREWRNYVSLVCRERACSCLVNV